MPIDNGAIAARFDEMADLLEIDDANPFRVRAYRNAARTLRGLGQSVATMLDEGEDLTKLPGIGKDLAAKIAELCASGELPQLQALEEQVPAGLTEVLGVAGIGPKRASALHEGLGVASLADLERAARAGRVRALPGFGAKTEARILRELETRGGAEQRMGLPEAEAAAEPLLAWLRETEGVQQAEIAGSYRRRRETVGDLDVLVTCTRRSQVVERFCAYGEVREVVSSGATRSTVVLKSGLQVDLRVVRQHAYGAALHYFTGAKAHNIHLRRMAQERGLKINEYGVFRGEERIAGATEAAVYAELGLPWITPELREDRGEIEAAQEDGLPALLTLEAIRGDLHCHTDASDGTRSLEQMAQAAKARGWSYLAITDRLRSPAVANGLDADGLARQLDAIDALNERLEGITLLKGCEVEILADGSLDLPEAILGRLELGVGAIHDPMDLSKAKQTERLMKAMDHPGCRLIAHPSGRRLGAREAYPLDMERVIAHAQETGCLLEVNAQPERLDLDDRHCKMAREAGVRLAVGTGARAEAHFAFMRHGVDQARRGWVTAADCVNTLPLAKLRRALRR